LKYGYDNFHRVIGYVRHVFTFYRLDTVKYANVWKTDFIARISPKTGKITGWIDLTGINPDPEKLKYPYVLNGIAYDEKSGHLIIAGKCWPELYEIELVPRINKE